MSNGVFATDHPLTAAQQQTLSALLDAILPASEDGKMPGAGEMDFLGYLQDNAGDFIPAIAQIVNGFTEDFSAMQPSQRQVLVEEFSRTESVLFQNLLFHLYGCYYQDDRTLQGLGLAAGPPFPRGNTVEAGDLSLLDPVMRSKRTYRKQVRGSIQ